MNNKIFYLLSALFFCGLQGVETSGEESETAQRYKIIREIQERFMEQPLSWQHLISSPPDYDLILPLRKSLILGLKSMMNSAHPSTVKADFEQKWIACESHFQCIEMVYLCHHQAAVADKHRSERELHKEKISKLDQLNNQS